MIIDTSNAPCGPGFLPGLRLSEGRFAINRRGSPLRGWGVAGTRCLRPPKCRPGKRERGTASHLRGYNPSSSVRGGGRQHCSHGGRGCRWTQVSALPALRVRCPCCASGAGARQVRVDGPALVARTPEPASSVGRAAGHPGDRSFRPGGPHHNHLTTTSDQTRQPAEFKHITKRRKRN